MNDDLRKIALERVKILFQNARSNLHDKPDLSQRYIEIAKKISTRTRVHLLPEHHTQICRHCKRFIVPGISSRVRIRSQREPHIVVTCLYCNGKTRMPIKGKKQK